MHQTPFFSIIIPAYNCKNYVLAAIQSVEKQTFQDWELLVVDDCSTDGTYEVVEDYIKEISNIKLFRTDSNTGSPSTPRNIGINRARGNYIGFLDADDMYLPQKLERHYKQIVIDTSIDILHTNYAIINKNKELLRHRKIPFFIRLYQRFLSPSMACLLTNPFCTSTTIFKKDLIEKYPFKDYGGLLSAVDDWYSWNRIFMDITPNIFYDQQVLTKYRWLEESISHKEKYVCELQAIIFFSILLYNRKIGFMKWSLGVFFRLMRVFLVKFFRYK